MKHSIGFINNKFACTCGRIFTGESVAEINEKAAIHLEAVRLKAIVLWSGFATFAIIGATAVTIYFGVFK